MMIELIILLFLAYIFRSSYSNISDNDVEDFIIFEHFSDEENF